MTHIYIEPLSAHQYPMQVLMGNQSQVNLDSYHTTRSLCDKHDRVSSLGNKTFRITPRVSYTHVTSFSPEGVNGPLLAPPNTHYLYFFFYYVLNGETFIGRRPNYELTTHSSIMMMSDYTHAHTPNIMRCPCAYAMLMSLHVLMSHV